MKVDIPTGPGMDRFNAAMDKLLSVSHEEMKRRMDAYKREAAKNPGNAGRNRNAMVSSELRSPR